MQPTTLSRFVLLASSLLKLGDAYRFKPENGRLNQFVPTLPTQYNLSDSQSVYGGNNTNSFWSSSFIQGSNSHQYLVISHALKTGFTDIYRASVLDVTNQSYFQQFSTLTNTTTVTAFNFEYPDFYFGLASSDKLGPINVRSSHAGVEFNLTYELSSPVILNGGTGTFQWQLPSIANEWSVPAGRTTGSLQVNGKTVTVDPANSFTWYDRQWQQGSASNWTWFELHLDGPNNAPLKASIWFYPSGSGGTEKGFATISDRTQPSEVHVVPAALIRGNRTWTSPFGWTYNLNWTIELENGVTLQINTGRDDQELTDPDGRLRTYEGWVQVSGDLGGYGLVEIEPLSASA